MVVKMYICSISTADTLRVEDWRGDAYVAVMPLISEMVLPSGVSPIDLMGLTLQHRKTVNCRCHAVFS